MLGLPRIRSTSINVPSDYKILVPCLRCIPMGASFAVMLARPLRTAQSVEYQVKWPSKSTTLPSCALAVALPKDLSHVYFVSFTEVASRVSHPKLLLLARGVPRPSVSIGVHPASFRRVHQPTEAFSSLRSESSGQSEQSTSTFAESLVCGFWYRYYVVALSPV